MWWHKFQFKQPPLTPVWEKCSIYKVSVFGFLLLQLLWKLATIYKSILHIVAQTVLKIPHKIHQITSFFFKFTKFQNIPWKGKLYLLFFQVYKSSFKKGGGGREGHWILHMTDNLRLTHIERPIKGPFFSPVSHLITPKHFAFWAYLSRGMPVSVLTLVGS